MGAINQKLSVIKEASIFVFTVPTVQGFGNTSGFEVIVQTAPADHCKNSVPLPMVLLAT